MSSRQTKQVPSRSSPEFLPAARGTPSTTSFSLKGDTLNRSSPQSAAAALRRDGEKHHHTQHLINDVQNWQKGLCNDCRGRVEIYVRDENV